MTLTQKSRSGDEKYFFEAVVAHRTNRQVTLFISVINKEVKRGLNFMEVYRILRTILQSNIFLHISSLICPNNRTSAKRFRCERNCLFCKKSM